MKIFGMPQCKDHSYAVASLLSYWVFRCRSKSSPAMGIKTWEFLESSIRNSAEVAIDLESYLQNLCDRLKARLLPSQLSLVLQPEQRILRVNKDNSLIEELVTDTVLAFVGWRDLLVQIEPLGFTEYDVLDLCRTKAGIIQVICRLRFEEDRAVGQDVVLEVEAEDVQ